MCGFVCYFSRGGSFEQRRLNLRKQTDALTHRGPDASGYFCEEAHRVALGHRRLSIVDLDERSTQPMRSSSGRSVIAFNGEIYNYRELALELEERGTRLRTTSDTEVLLELCELVGVERALERTVGMFAFAFYDLESREVVLARDRLGKKPLYYGFVGGDFVAASELGAVEASHREALTLNPEAFALLARYSFIPAPHSAYREMKKLLPGHFLRVTEAELATGTCPSSRPFWSLDSAIRAGEADRRRNLQPGEVVREVESILADAVRLRMRSDVPLGAFLSGGIDSPLVVALMAESSSSQVHTFSIGFGAAEYDESEDAFRIAKHLGTNHTQFVVAPSDVMELTSELAQIYDEPFADSSALPTTLVSRLARRHVTVVLTGDGGDEVFAGYNRHIWGQRVWRAMSGMPLELRSSLGSLVQKVSPATYTAIFEVMNRYLPSHLRVRSVGDKLHKLGRVASATDPEMLHLELASHFREGDGIFKEPLLTPELPTLHLGESELSALERALRFDSLLGLPADMLVKVDRASMSVGLEARQPLLDHRLVELAWRIPESFKYRDGVGKWVLREILAKRVPRALFDRPKMGFGVPIGFWMRDAMRPIVEDVLEESKLSATGLFDPKVVRQLLDAHLSGRVNADSRLWIVLMAELWLRKRNRSFS